MGSILYDCPAAVTTMAKDDNDSTRTTRAFLPLSVQLQRPEERTFQADWAKDLDKTQL